MLSGKIVLHLGNSQKKCRKGDSFYFKPTMPHYIENPGKTPRCCFGCLRRLAFKFLGDCVNGAVKAYRVKNISKAFDGDMVLENLDLYILKNEFITLLGPSGCGKTTTLRIIAGFEQPTAGNVYFNGADITDIPPYKRHVNTVFQKYALFPNMNVYNNIAFGLKIQKLPAKEIEQRVNEALELIDLPNYGHRKIDSLSGGQQQRIAIARALVNRPQVLLLDEPLGALDLKMRKEMQLELKKMQQQLGITFIYVTHDQEEALTMSDTIVVMAQGKIQQIGTPEMIYNEPRTALLLTL